MSKKKKSVKKDLKVDSSVLIFLGIVIIALILLCGYYFIVNCIMVLHLIKSDGGTSPMKSHQPIGLGGKARSIR